MSQEKKIYADRLAIVTDEFLISETETQVWLSAFAENNPRAPSHWRVDLCYEEARRREKPWLYKRGWNQAYASCGYELSQDDLAGARAPVEMAA